MISFDLNDELRMVQETVHSFAQAQIRPHLRAIEARGDLGSELRGKAEAMGVTTVYLPEEVGGAGLGSMGLAVVAEELAWGDVGAAAALLSSYPGACLIASVANADERTRWLGALSRGEVKLATALSEPGVDEIAVVAEPEGEGYRLSGEKAFVALGGEAALHLVIARTPGLEGEIGVYAAHPGEGLTQGARHGLLGLSALPFHRVRFDRCPATKLLGGEALGALLAKASLLSASLAVGCARASLEYALQYAQERQAFGKPIGHFQAIAFMLSDMAMDVDSARWMVWRAASGLDRGTAGPAEVAMAVRHAHEAALKVTDLGVQILGGHGYMQDHPVEKWMRDARTLALYLTSPEFADGWIESSVLGEAAPPAADALPVCSLQPVLT